MSGCDIVSMSSAVHAHATPRQLVLASAVSVEGAEFECGSDGGRE